MEQYTPPAFNEDAFHCPFCGVYSHQVWRNTTQVYSNTRGSCSLYMYLNGISSATCTRCTFYSLWKDQIMIYPIYGNAPLPNNDLPEDIKKDYLEAKEIINRSPRGAAALLRLALQKLCNYLGETGKIDAMIKNLVAKGLSPMIQQSLDILRVVGNNAVHPGTIDLDDTPEVAYSLFKLLNIISDSMITQPKNVATLYENIIPEGVKKSIETRDGKK